MSSLRDQLEQVRAEYGTLTAATALAAARDEDSPLHSRFEWDDSLAGEKYRLQQAGQLIRSVKIKYVEEPEERSVRAYSLTREPASEEEEASAIYLPTEEVVADDFGRELLLRQMRRDWAIFERRYRHLVEFAELIHPAAVVA